LDCLCSLLVEDWNDDHVGEELDHLFVVEEVVFCNTRSSRCIHWHQRTTYDLLEINSSL
jgi:hypothetical protein